MARGGAVGSTAGAGAGVPAPLVAGAGVAFVGAPIPENNMEARRTVTAPTNTIRRPFRRREDPRVEPTFAERGSTPHTFRVGRSAVAYISVQPAEPISVLSFWTGG